MLGAWFRLWRSGVPVGFNDVAGMRFRGVLRREFVDALIISHKAGLEIATNQLEAHLLAGGSPLAVVEAAIILQDTHAQAGFPFLSAIDLSGMPVRELAAAFATAARDYAALSFEDVAARYQAGEDVLEAASRGALAPPTESEGWLVRIECGPFTRETLRMLLEKGGIPRDALVKGPGETNWVRADSNAAFDD